MSFARLGANAGRVGPRSPLCSECDARQGGAKQLVGTAQVLLTDLAAGSRRIAAGPLPGRAASLRRTAGGPRPGRAAGLRQGFLLHLSDAQRLEVRAGRIGQQLKEPSLAVDS